MESILFGHEQGAFTGARQTHIRKFEFANWGTVFLDEIGEMPPGMRAKLLRALEEKTIERIGGKNPIRDTLVATNNNKRKAAGFLGINRATLHRRLKKMSEGVRPANMKRFTFIST